MHVGIAADHGGFALKAQLVAALKAAGHEVTDFGAHELVMGDDYPDYVIPLAEALAKGKVTRGLAICNGTTLFTGAACNPKVVGNHRYC